MDSGRRGSSQGYPGIPRVSGATGVGSTGTLEAARHDTHRAALLIIFPSQMYAELAVEIDTMQEKAGKLEVEALLAHGMEFMTEKYLPMKVLEGDTVL